MSSEPQRQRKENAARAAETFPEHRWLPIALVWIGVALSYGVVTYFVTPANISDAPNRWDLVHYLAAALLSVTVMYFVPYYAARHIMSRRSFKEIVKSEHNQYLINRFGLPLTLTAGSFAIVALTTGVNAWLYAGLLNVTTLFAIYRALTTAYTAHYYDYVISPSERRQTDNDKEIKSKKRIAVERILVSLGLRYPKNRLSLPLVQTVIVSFGIQALISAIWISFVDPSSADSLGAERWQQIFAPAAPLAAVIAWSMWHYYGGIGRVLRLSQGRQMSSYGARHPELVPQKDRSNTIDSKVA